MTLDWLRTDTTELCTQGAHLARWRDMLFLSSRSRFERGQAIRGGIPLIFPWFGDDPLKLGRGAHGFARRVEWRVVEHEERASGLRARLELRDDDTTRALWPHRFRAELFVDAGDELTLELTGVPPTSVCNAAFTAEPAQIQLQQAQGMDEPLVFEGTTATLTGELFTSPSGEAFSRFDVAVFVTRIVVDAVAAV